MATPRLPTESQYLPQRLPLVTPLKNRDASMDEDAKLVNCYAEFDPHSEEFHIYKRPGLLTYITKSGGGQGTYNWNGDIYSVFGGFLYKNSVQVAAVNASNGTYRFSIVRGTPPKIVLGNGVKAYTFDGSAGSFTEINDPDFPTSFVKGWAYLDGTLYVMTPEGEIYGSDIDGPEDWDPLNKIIARIEPDRGVALAKQNNYVIALKEWTTEVFYDAENPEGSPLAPVQGAHSNLGCLSADSVQEVDGILLWVSTNKNASPQVAMMESLKVTVVSSPAVERILDDANYATVHSWILKRSGHRFYGLTIPETNFTLVYDIDQKLWYQWTDKDGNYWPIVSQTYNVGAVNGHFVQHESNGKLYLLDGHHVYPTDDDDIFPVDIYTPNFDWGVDRKKMLTQLRFHADRVEGSTLMVRFSDDDYKTWSHFRPVNLGSIRPMLINNGTFYRRAYHFRHMDDLPFRMQAISMSLDLGTL